MQIKLVVVVVVVVVVIVVVVVVVVVLVVVRACIGWECLAPLHSRHITISSNF